MNREEDASLESLPCEQKDDEPLYAADQSYLEECTYIVIVEMLERLPHLKPRIKNYLEIDAVTAEQVAERTR